MAAVVSSTKLSKKRDSASALRFARASAAVTAAIEGRPLLPEDVETLEDFGGALCAVADAARFADGPSRPARSRRQVAVVGLALGAARRTNAEHEASGSELAERIEKLGSDVLSLARSQATEQPDQLRAFMRQLVALSGRRAASPGDTVVRTQP